MRLHVSATLILILTICKAHGNFCSDYPDWCEEIQAFWQENQSLFEVARAVGVDPLFAFCIVAPEVGRTGAIQDALETAIVELFYVEQGTQYANFSIGVFQMKPSFIEALETRFANDSTFATHFGYASTDVRLQRRERVGRLQSVGWQIKYLCLFCRHVQQKERDQSLTFERDIDRLSLYATAYNVGIDASHQELLRWMGIRHFPSGGGDKSYAYGTVSQEIYSNLTQK